MTEKPDFHDLRKIYNALNLVYFDSLLEAKIEWFRVGSPRDGVSRKGMHFGYYSVEENTIRISPTLNAKWVPNYYVAYVVFHEMLHQIIPPELSQVQRGETPAINWHPASFYQAEARYAHIKRAQHWEAKNLNRLLRSDCREHPRRKRSKAEAHDDDE